jgi:hypothetical protein
MPGRKPLVTLRDAAQYITKLPKAEHDTEEWRAAMQALLLVAEHNGPPMFARYHDGVEQPRRTRVRPVAQRQALGKAEAGAGSMMDVRSRYLGKAG